MPSMPDDSNAAAAPDTPSIAKWTRVYAQNRRSLAVAVFLALYACLTVAIGGLSYLAGSAYRSDSMTLFAVSIVVLIPVTAGIVYLAIPRFGGRLIEQMISRHYAEEGSISLLVPTTGRRPWAVLLAVSFAVCVVAMVWFGQSIPSGYQQPVSALFVVPFLVALALMMRPGVGFIPLLWPALYALHALLIVAGAPIVFTGVWASLNTLIPIVGYGLLTALVGYAYSRFAWHRLRTLAGTDESAARGPQEAGGP